MKFRGLSILGLLFLAGCFATMPPPVKDEYIKDKTEAEEKKIAQIEDSIITIKKDKDELARRIKIIKQERAVVQKTIPQLEGKLGELKEKQKLYALKEDTAALEQTNTEKEAVETDLKAEKAKLKYYNVKLQDEEARLEIKHAELSVAVASLNLEKARIARRYQEKLLATKSSEGADKKKEAKKLEKEMIQVKQYSEYLERQQKDLKEKREYQQKTAERLAAVEKETDAGVIIKATDR